MKIWSDPFARFEIAAQDNAKLFLFLIKTEKGFYRSGLMRFAAIQRFVRNWDATFQIKILAGARYACCARKLSEARIRRIIGFHRNAMRGIQKSAQSVIQTSDCLLLLYQNACACSEGATHRGKGGCDFVELRF
jgi:hypothetical protein